MLRKFSKRSKTKSGPLSLTGLPTSCPRNLSDLPKTPRAGNNTEKAAEDEDPVYTLTESDTPSTYGSSIASHKLECSVVMMAPEHYQLVREFTIANQAATEAQWFPSTEQQFAEKLMASSCGSDAGGAMRYYLFMHQQETIIALITLLVQDSRPWDSERSLRVVDMIITSRYRVNRNLIGAITSFLGTLAKQWGCHKTIIDLDTAFLKRYVQDDMTAV